MALTWQPEKSEQLKERFNKVISRVFDIEKMMNGEGQRPGELRDHVFDFEDGIRLIASMDKVDGHIFLHVSGSLHHKQMTSEELTKAIGEKVVEFYKGHISGVAQAIKTAGGIVHMLIKIGPEWQSKVVMPPFYNAN